MNDTKKVFFIASRAVLIFLYLLSPLSRLYGMPLPFGMTRINISYLILATVAVIVIVSVLMKWKTKKTKRNIPRFILLLVNLLVIYPWLTNLYTTNTWMRPILLVYPAACLLYYTVQSYRENFGQHSIG